MRKKLATKVLSLILTGIMMASVTACGSGVGSSDEGSSATPAATAPAADAETTERADAAPAEITVPGEPFKIGVLVSDATSAEALGRRHYLEDYIAKAYNMVFVYSDELTDSAGEKAAIETMITNNCKAILSESSFDRPAQIEQCEAAGVYYAVGSGALDAEQYETYKGYTYYVGSVGPSDATEFETGYQMAKYYLDQGVRNFAIFGGATVYRNSMHVNRVAGMIKAMVDAGGEGASYQGMTDPGAIIGQLMADGEAHTGEIGDVVLSGYLGGYDMDDAWFAKGAEMVQAPGVEVLLAVGSGSDFFGTATNGTDVKIASVDAYAQDYYEAMANGSLDYLVGKFSAYDGPVFMALYRAVNGNPLRDPEGNAPAFDIGYWISTSAEACKEMLDVDGDIDHPVWTLEELNALYDADYAAFEAFVGNYAFDKIR